MRYVLSPLFDLLLGIEKRHISDRVLLRRARGLERADQRRQLCPVVRIVENCAHRHSTAVSATRPTSLRKGAYIASRRQQRPGWKSLSSTMARHRAMPPCARFLNERNMVQMSQVLRSQPCLASLRRSLASADLKDFCRATRHSINGTSVRSFRSRSATCACMACDRAPSQARSSPRGDHQRRALAG